MFTKLVSWLSGWVLKKANDKKFEGNTVELLDGGTQFTKAERLFLINLRIMLDENGVTLHNFVSNKTLLTHCREIISYLIIGEAMRNGSLSDRDVWVILLYSASRLTGASFKVKSGSIEQISEHRAKIDTDLYCLEGMSAYRDTEQKMKIHPKLTAFPVKQALSNIYVDSLRRS